MNGETAPVFSSVYLNKKLLLDDVERAISTGTIRRASAVPISKIQPIIISALPLEIVVDFELKRFNSGNIWQACRDFTLWLDAKKSALNDGQVERFKGLFIDENLMGDKRASLREALLRKSAAEFLEMVAVEKEKSRLEREKKLSDG